MLYENNKDEWVKMNRPIAQIEKNGVSGKYTVWIYCSIASGEESVITKGPLVFNNELYNLGVGGSAPPSEFDTEQAALEAYRDYRKRNPLYSQRPAKENEVIKTLFE